MLAELAVGGMTAHIGGEYALHKREHDLSARNRLRSI
jgi:hypothetical protein